MVKRFMESAGPSLRRWPRRDFLLLPLIVAGTMIALFVPAELVSRALYPAVDIDTCALPTRAGSFHSQPDCTSRMKTPEGPWAETRYNECGFRSPEACAAKPAGSLRVAVLGSSTSAGYLTPYPETMAARAAAALTRRCRRPVQFQNLGAKGNHGERLLASGRAAVKMGADAVVLVVSPIDFELTKEVSPAAVPRSRSTNPLRQIKDLLSSSRLLYMESYFILREDTAYVPIFLASGGNGDFMRLPLSVTWTRRLAEFDAMMEQLATLTTARGLPAMLVFVPQRAEAAIAAGDPVDHIHPLLLPDLLGKIAARHGILFRDMTRMLPRGVQSQRYFYAVNGHINGHGHALAASGIVDGLESMPSFTAACSTPVT